MASDPPAQHAPILVLRSMMIGAGLWILLFLAFLAPLLIRVQGGDPLTTQILEVRGGEATQFTLRVLWLHATVGALGGAIASIPILAMGRRSAQTSKTTWKRMVIANLACLVFFAAYGAIDRPVFLDPYMNLQGPPWSWIQNTLTDWLSPTIVAIGATVVVVGIVLRFRRPTLWWAIPASVLLLFGIAPSLMTTRATFEGPPNVLIIAMDSLRADRTGGEDYPRDLTPNIDRVAEKGVRFRRAYVPLARTLPSWTSLLTSVYPHTHGIRDMFPPPHRREVRVPSLCDSLDDAYKSFVVSDYAGESFSLIDFGFDEVDCPPPSTLALALRREILLAFPLLIPALNNSLGHSLAPTLRYLNENPHPFVVTERVFDHVDRAVRDQRPFFATVFYSGAHTPYAAPHPGYDRYTDENYDGPNKYAFSVRDPRRISEIENVLPKEEIEQTIALYDGSIALTDEAIGQLLDGLEDRGILDNTIVVITADHGEHLYEHGNAIDHGKWFRGGDAANRVPLIFAGPGVPDDGRVVESPVRSLDIVPTLMSLLGRRPEPGDFEGVDLAPWWRDESSQVELPVFAETGLWLAAPAMHRDDPEAISYPSITEILAADPLDDTLVLKDQFTERSVEAKHRMLLRGSFKLVYEPIQGGVRWRLFNVEKDPGNQRDLSHSHKAILEPMKRELLNWLAKDPSRKLDSHGHLMPHWTYYE